MFSDVEIRKIYATYCQSSDQLAIIFDDSVPIPYCLQRPGFIGRFSGQSACRSQVVEVKISCQFSSCCAVALHFKGETSSQTFTCTHIQWANHHH